MRNWYLMAFFTLHAIHITLQDEMEGQYSADCKNLLLGQYLCPDPEYNFVDPKTQQPWGCTKENIALVRCKAADGIICSETNNSTFHKEMPCQWTNGYYFDTALLLSIFLGMFGVDRFYLGYPAIGVLKFCTLGFLFFGWILDVILIAMQIVGPSDGSHYVMPYYGPQLHISTGTNWTYMLPESDWVVPTNQEL